RTFVATLTPSRRVGWRALGSNRIAHLAARAQPPPGLRDGARVRTDQPRRDSEPHRTGAIHRVGPRHRAAARRAFAREEHGHSERGASSGRPASGSAGAEAGCLSWTW